MARATTVLVVALLAVPPAWAGFRGRVVGISAGDAVEVRDVHRVKHAVSLRCVDAPDPGQAFDEASKEHLAGLVSGKVVTVSEETTDPDGRLSAAIQRGNIEVNLRMVVDGYAWHSPDDACDGSYAEAQSAARAARRGLWQDDSPVPPWEFNAQ
jgi:endonuclease YncB( thermonuclease family)